MAELKITDLVDKSQIKELKDLAAAIEQVKDIYADAARELAKGLKITVDSKGDLDKLHAVIASSSKKAAEGNEVLNAALRKQHELSDRLAQSIDKVAKSGNMSAKEAKALADASKRNAEALEKEAKAEAALEKARKAGNATRKAVNLTEEERKKTISDAIALSKKEVHSIAEANEANKQLRAAVKLVKDTDEDYMNTLGRLNSTIGVNTDYVKRNSDRYTQQKMTIGNYKEEIKQAWYEINRGNVSMKNMGIIAGNTGKILQSSFTTGVKQVGVSVAGMIKGFVGAQAVILAIQKLVGLLKGGITTAIDFEAANSKLAAILGTTAKQTKDLQIQARELGATTKYTAAEATNLQIELAKLGFTIREIKDSTPHILKFAQATGAELADAASLAGAALRMFNADTAETERYVAAMAVATTKSALSFSYLATAMPIVGPVANQFNFTIEDTLALLGKLADSGFDASMAATATRNIFLNLADSGGKLAQALGKPVTNLPELMEGLVALKERGIDLNETLKLTDKRSVGAMSVFIEMAKTIVPLREQITGVEDELGAMASEMSNNTAGAIKTLESAWDELMISINGNTGAVRVLVEMTTSAVRWMTELVQSTDELFARQKEQAKSLGLEAGGDSFKRQEALVNAAKDAFVKAGFDENVALAKAKSERIAILKAQYDKEHKLMQEAYDRYQSLSKRYDESNFLERATNGSFKEMKASIEANKKVYLEQIKLVESLQKQMDAVGGMKIAEKTVTTTEETEEQRNARLKAEKDLQDATISLMEDGIEKEIAVISNNYNRKIAAITGNSKAEKELRIALGELMQQEILAKQEEYNSKALTEEQQAAADRISAIAENAAAEQVLRDRQYELDLLALEKRKELGELSDEDYEREKYQITARYAKESADAVISSLEEQLLVENLTAEERERIAKELADAKHKIAKEEAEEEINLIKKVKDEDKKASKERQKNLEDWLNVAADAVSTIGDFVSTLYDAQLEKLEEESEANQEAHDAEIERIDHLAETGAISTEEAEARKRAAEDRTAQKEAELEKKKQQIAYKQAVWNKANQLAQTGIATALGIMQALAMWPPNIPLAAIVGAMGAVQMATIMATPIPKYAKGTKDHPGGPAIVGDGGRSEAVVTDKGIWLTPSVPTVVDLPRHAVVYPDADRLQGDFVPEFSSPLMSKGEMMFSDRTTTVVNDYSKLEREMKATNTLIAHGIKDARKRDAQRDLELYKRSRMI